MRRILHVVGRLDPGGIEVWLMNVLKHINRERYQLDFLVTSGRPGAYDDRAGELGARISHYGSHKRPWVFARGFRRAIREDGPYDVVHSHVHHYSGYVLHLAQQAGVPMRIAHSHSLLPDISLLGPFRRMYLRLMERYIDTHATLGLATSGKAAEALFGPCWQRHARRRVLLCGIELAPFRQAPDGGEGRAELGIPPGALVMGHVGRLVHEKNHRFLLQVAAEVARREGNFRLLLIGDGPLRAETERRAAALGLAGKVIFAGVRHDVARLMPNAMDVFVFPSVSEGCAVALAEAQAAGLPCVLSDVIPAEVDVVVPLMRRLSLSVPPSVWANEVLAAHRDPERPTREQAFSMIENSPFNVARCVRDLERYYDGELP